MQLQQLLAGGRAAAAAAAVAAAAATARRRPRSRPPRPLRLPRLQPPVLVLVLLVWLFGRVREEVGRDGRMRRVAVTRASAGELVQVTHTSRFLVCEGSKNTRLPPVPGIRPPARPARPKKARAWQREDMREGPRSTHRMVAGAANRVGARNRGTTFWHLPALSLPPARARAPVPVARPAASGVTGCSGPSHQRRTRILGARAGPMWERGSPDGCVCVCLSLSRSSARARVNRW
jgi:hypothetical protein